MIPLTILIVDTPVQSSEFSDIACQDDGSTNRCGRITIVDVKRINFCEVHYTYAVQELLNWKGKINPSDAKFNKIAKKRLNSPDSRANCCKYTLDGALIGDASSIEFRDYTNPRGLFNEICRMSGVS